ncbi:MAG TPA: AraC family transcriptional regulator ligand-binding domain-containing protein [Kofleriaceae bacterium]|nr:AraC family transcriptional regulator ligand-binding domain-containing protein [Kofleriaceae bacterium]
MPTVVAAWTQVIVDYAAARGIDVTRPDVDLSHRDLRVPAHLDDAIWQAADHALGDDDLGIHIAESGISAESFGVVGYLVRASTTVGEALARAQQFHRLVKDRGRLEIAATPTGAVVIDAPELDRAQWPRPIAELTIANYLHLARAWTGARIVPREVRFQHARPRNTRELERFFGARLRFDQRDNALVLERDVLGLPFTTSEPALGAYLEASASARLETLPAPSLVDEVRAAIDDELRGGDVDIERVARKVGVTPRSLQRRLREEGTSYRELIDTVRHKRAVDLLQRGIPFGDIAERLGFSEARAFRRAFRRWTGLVPSAVARGA